MGYFIRFILALIVINFVIRLVIRFFLKWNGRKTNYSAYNQQQYRRENRQNAQEAPTTQEERILDFQKKSFNTEEAEDADFIEVKDNK